MGRFSTGVKVLSRRLNQLESKRAMSDLPKALMEFSLYGKVPESEELMVKIYLIQATVRAMAETVPKPVED